MSPSPLKSCGRYSFVLSASIGRTPGLVTRGSQYAKRMTRTMRLVARLREDREFADVRVTPLLVVAKALLLAVHCHPEINTSWDDEAREIVYKHYINLGIAAATPRGLVVPNIKDTTGSRSWSSRRSSRR